MIEKVVRPGTHTFTAQRIEEIIAAQEPLFRRAFTLAIQNITDSFTLNELADLLEAGQFELALRELEAASLLLGGAYGESMGNAAREAATFLSTALTVTVSFDASNTFAVSAIRENTLRLVSGFTRSQREAVRDTIMDGIARGLNPIEQARNFRQSIGLTSTQTGWVRNYRSSLENLSRDALNRELRDKRFDRTINRAIVDGTPLTEDQIERMVNRYRERMIRYRSEVIARTEALRSVHEGVEAMYNQAIQNGQLSPDELERTWVTARDERVRSSHRELNGQKRGIGETWEAAGGTLRFPGDPRAPGSETIQCRCTLTTRIRPNAS